MATEDNATEVTEFGPFPPPTAERTTWGIGIPLWKLLYTQNPFYLLSVCFVLHGTGRWFHETAGQFNPWAMMGLICAYILMMAAAAYVVVRFGKVWDDARSIFLILLLLFVELSLTFDDVLINSPWTGIALLLAGLVFSIVVWESLLCSLRIRLPAFFRVPYHALMALLFLYPLLVIATPAVARQWVMALFPTVTGLILLTLLPAIRRGPGYITPNGTPWPWPWFPYVLFGFLTLCCGGRAYAICLSFDPVLDLPLVAAMEMDSIFGMYFLIPLVLVVAVLMLEIGIVGGYQRVQRLALCLPMACLSFSFPSVVRGEPYQRFLEIFTATLGSPAYVAAIAVTGWYGYAWLRRVRFAEEACYASLFWLAMLSPQTLRFHLPIVLHAPALVVAAFLLGVRGWQLKDSARVFLSLLAVSGAIWTELHWSTRWNTVCGAHLILASILIVSFTFEGQFARLLRHISVMSLLLATAAAAMATDSGFLPISTEIRTLYLTVVPLVVFGYAYGFRSLFYFTAGILAAGITGTAFGFELYRYLATTTRWSGIGSFMIGLAWLGLALVISAWKGGLLQYARWLLPRTPSS